MFGIKLWVDAVSSETALQKGDEIWIKQVIRGQLRCLEISATRGDTILLLGNECCRLSVLPLVSSSLKFPDLNIHQIVVLLSDLLTLGGKSCTSHYTFGNGDPVGQIVIG